MTTQCVVRAAERPSPQRENLLLPLANFFYKRNTAAFFFYFTRIAIIYPLFCCGRGLLLPYNLPIYCLGIRVGVGVRDDPRKMK